jgi:hypothetical protein
MGLSRKAAEALGLGHLYPKGSRGSAHERFKMNRAEARFAEWQEGRRLAGEIRAWSFERDTLVLTPDMKYTPDFRIEELTGLFTFVDVKGGHVWEDSIIKAKAAAGLFPWHQFFIATWRPDRIARNRLVLAQWDLRQMGVARETPNQASGEC